MSKKSTVGYLLLYSILNLTYYSHQSSRFICNNTAAFLIMLLWNWKTTLYFLTCK